MKEVKEIRLSNGILIKDARALACGVTFENQNTKFMTLAYSSSEGGFYLNITGRWLMPEDVEEYTREFDTMKAILNEAVKAAGNAVCVDRLDRVITDGSYLSVQKAGVHRVYAKDNGLLYFKPYGTEEKVSAYFRGDLELVDEPEARDYDKDLDKWENSFYCNECGRDEMKDFKYDRSVANGEVWHCTCGHEVMVDHKPNEDNY